MAIKPQLTEAGIQTAVWQVELGRGKTFVKWLAVVLATALVMLTYTASQFRGLEKREAMDQAQLARHIARGEGYTTSLIRPLSLWYLEQHDWAQDDPRLLGEHPDLVNPPLYPFVLAGLFKLLPESAFEYKPTERLYLPERWVILPFNQLCLILSLLLVYFWTKQIFDRRVAVMAGLLLLFSDTLWAYAVSGLATNLLMLLFLLALYCLYLADHRFEPPQVTNDEQPESLEPARRPDGWTVLLVLAGGALLGLCFLTRYRMAFLLVPLALYVLWIFRGHKSALWLLGYVAAFLIVIAPWIAHTWQISGRPLGLAAYEFVNGAGPIQGDVLMRSYHPEELIEVAATIKPLSSKLLINARGHLTNSLKMIGTDFLLCFFVAGLMYGFRRRPAAHLRLVVLAGLGFSILAMSLLGLARETGSKEVHGGNLLVLLLPLVVAYGVAFFYLLLDRIQFRMRLTHNLACTAFVLINVAPIIFTLLPPRRGAFPYPPYIAPYTYATATMFEKSEFGVSDLPWAMAWIGDRRTLWLPMTIKDFEDINDYVAQRPGFSFLMLTPYMLDRPFKSDLIKGEYKGWSEIVRGELPKNFPLREVTPIPPGNDQLLIADKPRWEKTASPQDKPAADTTQTPAGTTAPAPGS